MKTEKKLIVCSIAALLIGVSAVVPLAFLMFATAQPNTGPEPWFSIDMPYSYWETLDGPIINPNFPFTVESEMNETNSVSQQHTIPLNITVIADTTAQQSVDAQLEYFKIEINTDKEYLMTQYFMVGTNGNSDFCPYPLLNEFNFNRPEWFSTDDFDPMLGGGGALVKEDWTEGMWTIFPVGGSESGTIDGSSGSSHVDVLRAAETITISIYRVGFVTFSGNSTIVTLSNNELVDQIQLEKYGEAGFLYNDLIPEEDLATIDLMRPVSYESLP